MKYPYELKIFSVILLSTLLIFSFSHFGVLAFEGLALKAKGFQENTWIGPMDVSGIEKTKANEHLIAKVNEWQTNSSIQISYKEVNTKLPTSDIYFKVDESVEVAKDSTKNELFIQIEDSSVLAVLASISSTFTESKVDIDLLKKELVNKVNILQADTIILNLEDYLTSPVMEEQVVHSVKIPNINDDLKNIGATLKIEPKATFSLLQFLEKQGLTSLDQNVINLISSGVYQAILPTNFEFLERHIGVNLPEHISLGYEAKLDSKLKKDLLFYNPNNDSYKIEIYNDSQFLIFDVVGVPFLYEYTIMQEGLQLYDPKTIKQYNPLLETGQTKVTRHGQKGLYVEVSRLVEDETGKMIEQQLISKDYYAPVHQIVVFSLSDKAAKDINGNPITDVNEGDNSDISTDLSDFPIEIDTPDDPSADKVEELDPIWGGPDDSEK
jgi:hypothetical protein